MWLRRGAVIALVLAAAAAHGKSLAHQHHDAPLMTDPTTRRLLYHLTDADQAATGLRTLSVTLTLPPASDKAAGGQTRPWPLIILYNGFKVRVRSLTQASSHVTERPFTAVNIPCR